MIDAGNFQPAIARLRFLLESRSILEDYHLYYLGFSLARFGEPAEAANVLEQLTRDHPRSIHRDAGWLELGRVRGHLGDVSRAKQALEMATRSDDPTVARPGEIELARSELAAGEIQSAAWRLQRLRRDASGSEHGRKAKAALRDLRSVHPELIPTGASLVEELRILVAEGDWAAAEALSRTLLSESERNGAAELRRLRAQALLGLGRVEEAVTVLHDVVASSREPGVAAATLFRIASLLWNRDRDEAALATFEDLLRRFPGASQSTEVRYAIGRIHETAGRLERAVQEYDDLARRAPGGKLGREARWRIGWIHFGRGDWARAERAFAPLARCPLVEACADALYWQARALERQGRTPSALALYRRLVDRAPTSCYAMWAEDRLGIATEGSSAVVVPDDHVELSPVTADRLARASALKQLGLLHFARAELAAHERDSNHDLVELRRLLRWYPAVDGHHAAMRLARRLGDRAGLTHDERQRLLYPLGFWRLVESTARDAGLDPLLVAALIRQESLYDPEARSPADARGLMQLLPSTAQRLAGEPVSLAELDRPERNVALGTRYLAMLVSKLGQDPLRALAAYNAGEAAVAKWERRAAGRERDEFVEAISYRETRDYVKRVIAGWRQYRALYAR
jgi:soluble lytic murein transglycosylase